MDQGKGDITLEVCFWREKQQNGHGFDQPRSPLLLVFAVENGLICAEASLALSEEVDISSLGCYMVDRS